MRVFHVDLPKAVLGFVGVHLGLRAEVAHVERLVVAGDAAMAQRRAALLGRVLHHHHRAEDTVLFPALRDRNPGVSTTTDELERQHDELDLALAGLVNDEASIEHVRQLIERHLSAEERHVLPVWLASFSADEHERFAARLRRSTPLRDAGLMIAWLLDTATEGAIDVAWSQVPSSLRLMHRCWWRQRYTRTFGTMSDAGLPAVPALLAAA